MFARIRCGCVFVLVLSALLFTSSRAAWAYSTGIQNTWGFDASAAPYTGVACNGCHSNPGTNAGPTLLSAPSPIVVANGVTTKYTITVNTNSAGAGINVRAFNTAGGAASGTLSLCSAATDANCGNLKTIGTPVQITHTAPHAGTTVSFAFNYTAPASGCYEDELQIWINSVNLSGSNSGDHANRFDVFISNSGSSCTDDGNVCTTDLCSASGACVHAAGNAGTICRSASGSCDVAETCDGLSTACPADGFKTNGTACNDGNACTLNDQCNGGACGGTSVSCNAPPPCHTAVGATCDPTSGACIYPAATDGSACDDGNVCTTNDTCTGGICGGSAVQCSTPPACHTAAGAACNPATGVCAYPNASDGSVCSDGNGCTQTDQCQAGVCVGSNPLACTTPGACQTAVGAVCNPASGACSYPNKPDGSGCGDGNACTQNDQCVGGACVAGTPVVCDAPPACRLATGATCDPTTGQCNYPKDIDGTACDDGNACTQNDACQNGSCIGANAVICPPPADCHDQGVCDTTTGQCTDPLKADGSACSDSEACTQTDTCINGTCSGANPVVCPTPDQCHDQGTCDAATGTCDNPAKSDGTPCDDHDLCTANDSCVSGTCTAGTPVACTPLDECHTAGVCNPASGDCSNPNQPNGTRCSKGTCQDGVCGSSSASSGSGGGVTGSGTGGAGAGGGGVTGTGMDTGGAAGDTAAGESGGCGCRLVGGEDGGEGVGALGILVVAAIGSRRRRSARRSPPSRLQSLRVS